ncbi:transcription initiation factor TFIID subunit 4-like isoform X2 [Phlebotomus argentipes]|uniref:transcription initiation factor TFIID subunit 4-like isoform X2 n=1 Tax=Phlebotomus argentipes TaxID=94469 RepID=UPI00289367E6|nr:transcription initiation factor TFIID subunit 4-like isoform X2 [Phlebotomus argentipes]
MASAVSSTDVEPSAALSDVREAAYHSESGHEVSLAQGQATGATVSGLVSNGGAAFSEAPHKLQHGPVVSDSRSASVSNNNNNYKRASEGPHAALEGPAVSNMPKNSNEPVKLVYPQAATVVGGSGHGQTSAPTVLNMNNRVTFTGQTLPNGTISLSPITTQATIMQTAANAKTPQTSQNQSQPAQSQQSTIVIKNQVSMAPGITSAPPGMVTMTKTINQATTQNIVATPAMLPASVQIVNMRPGTPSQAQQKSVAAVQPRVVLGGTQMLGARPTNSAITLSALQNLNAGQSGPALLLKTETGQYQLLRVGPAPATPVTPSMGATAASANQTIRLQTVPAQTLTTTTANIVVNTTASTAMSAQQTQILSTQTSQVPPPVASVAPVPALAAQNATAAVVVTANATPTNQNLHNTKEKCRKFLANLLELSSREPKTVERNVRTLIQELIDANVEPEEFCDRLERLLNASPQPCLIGFLRKSLPLLRQSLVKKELVIEGIKPPPHTVAFSGTTTITTNIPATVRPIGQTIASGVTTLPTQVRMVTPSGPRPMQTTITRHAAPVRIQTPISTTGPRLTGGTVAQIRPGANAIVQTAGAIQSTPPALHPVSSTPTQTVFSPTGQIRTPTTLTRPQSAVHIRTTTPVVRTPTATKGATQIKIGATQIKQITPSAGSGIANATLLNSNSSIGGVMQKAMTVKSQTAAQAQKSAAAAAKDKEKKAANFYQQSTLSMSSSMYGDDDINDVAAMGGVNLAEETQRILGSTELIGTQIRSCKDEVFLHLPALQNVMRAIVAKHGLEEPSNEVAVLISHATQEHLKNIVEKLAVIAEHRIDVIKLDPRYEVTKDVRGQIKFLEELDKAEQKRHEEQEREMLLRAAKSRSKTEDPEQAKLKAKAKEMQRAEMEELRQRDANLTALQAIGPRKKPRLDGEISSTAVAGASGVGATGLAATPLRPRIKRVNMRDMLFYLEQERDTCRSTMLYKAYLK